MDVRITKSSRRTIFLRDRRELASAMPLIATSNGGAFGTDADFRYSGVSASLTPFRLIPALEGCPEHVEPAFAPCDRYS